MTGPDVLASGFFYPEGLAWDTEHHDVICTAVQDARVFSVTMAGAVTLVAALEGGANNAALTEDGRIVVAQNGGIDGYEWLRSMYPDLDPWPAVKPARPGLQIVGRDGRFGYLAHDVDTPNDLAAAPDGTLFVTDPGNPFHDPKPPARVMACSPDGELRVAATGFDYCNGIAADAEGIVVTDLSGVARIRADGSRHWIARWGSEAAPPDGIAFDEEGRLYVAAGRESGVRVFDGGELVEFLAIPGDGTTTNCCFVGDDLRTLLATDARHGTIVAWTGMPSPGRPVSRWRPSAQLLDVPGR